MSVCSFREKSITAHYAHQDNLLCGYIIGWLLERFCGKTMNFACYAVESKVLSMVLIILKPPICHAI